MESLQTVPHLPLRSTSIRPWTANVPYPEVFIAVAELIIRIPGYAPAREALSSWSQPTHMSFACVQLLF